MSAGLHTERLPVLFPIRALAWIVGQVPGLGHGEATDRCFSCTRRFLSLTVSLPSLLLRKKKKKLDMLVIGEIKRDSSPAF